MFFVVFLLLFQPRDKAKLCPKSREPHQKEKDEKEKKKEKINIREDKRKCFLKHTVRNTEDGKYTVKSYSYKCNLQ